MQDYALTNYGGGALELDAPVATTSGTSITISTTIPAWAKRITVMYNDISTNLNLTNNTKEIQDERDQIQDMRKLYNSFDDDKKPEWLAFEQIGDYEKKMLQTVE